MRSIFPAIGNATGPYDIINVTDPGWWLGASFTGAGLWLTAYDTGNDDVYYGVTNISSQTQSPTSACRAPASSVSKMMASAPGQPTQERLLPYDGPVHHAKRRR